MPLYLCDCPDQQKKKRSTVASKVQTAVHHYLLQIYCLTVSHSKEICEEFTAMVLL